MWEEDFTVKTLVPATNTSIYKVNNTAKRNRRERGLEWKRKLFVHWWNTSAWIWIFLVISWCILFGCSINNLNRENFMYLKETVSGLGISVSRKVSWTELHWKKMDWRVLPDTSHYWETTWDLVQVFWNPRIERLREASGKTKGIRLLAYFLRMDSSG